MLILVIFIGLLEVFYWHCKASCGEAFAISLNAAEAVPLSWFGFELLALVALGCAGVLATPGLFVRFFLGSIVLVVWMIGKQWKQWIKSVWNNTDWHWTPKFIQARSIQSMKINHNKQRIMLYYLWLIKFHYNIIELNWYSNLILLMTHQTSPYY